jgi:hypothetical protein
VRPLDPSRAMGMDDKPQDDDAGKWG